MEDAVQLSPSLPTSMQDLPVPARFHRGEQGRKAALRDSLRSLIASNDEPALGLSPPGQSEQRLISSVEVRSNDEVGNSASDQDVSFGANRDVHGSAGGVGESGYSPVRRSGQPGRASGQPRGATGGLRNDGALFSAIRKAIQNHVRYPVSARRAGLAGRVDVRIHLGPDGLARSVIVTRSTGYSDLDDAALKAVNHSLPLPHANRDVYVTVPVVFELN